MATKLKGIKAFTPYAIGPAFYKWCGNAAKKPEKTAQVIEHFIHRDPDANQWGTIGLIEPLGEDGQYVHPLDGAAFLLMFKISQKILPGAVRDKELMKRLAKLESKKGAAATKQEYAQIRDDVENALLPKAFVRDTNIPVLVYKDKLVFCTSSAAKVEHMHGMIHRLCEVRDVALDFSGIQTADRIGFMLTQMARMGQQDIDGDYLLTAGRSGVFKRVDKAVARVKDRELSHQEVQKVLDNGYEATELALNLVDYDAEIVRAHFTLTDKWVVKGLKLADKDELRTAEDMHATYWLYATYIAHIFHTLVAALSTGDDPSGEESDDEL